MCLRFEDFEAFTLFRDVGLMMAFLMGDARSSSSLVSWMVGYASHDEHLWVPVAR
jgi:hypothetical protein